MKKVLAGIFVSLLSFVLIACNNNTKYNLRIGVDFYPMADIVRLIEDDLAAEGIYVELVEMDYNVLNGPLQNGEIDANMIQHRHFMAEFNRANQGNLVMAQPIYHSTFAIYSAYYNLEDNEPLIDIIEDGETVHLPLDSVNLARALHLLQTAGLIELAEGRLFDATLTDVVVNTKNLNFELSSILNTPGYYDDGGRRLAVMYPTYVRLRLGFEDDSEFLFVEPLDEFAETYAISLVAKEGYTSNENLVKFIELLTSQKVRQFLLDDYGWAATPAF